MSSVRNLDSGLQSALAGIQRELRSAAENASKISRASSTLEEGGDIVEPMIGLKEDLRNVQALRKVIQITDKMEDEVLNIIA